jgi:hypothetical protein
MSYVKTAEDVKSFLPHGALLVQDNIPAIPLIDLEVIEEKNGPVLVGWAYPSKEFYFELSNVLPQKGGWLVFNRGRRAVLRPLTEHIAQQTRDMMDSV